LNRDETAAQSLFDEIRAAITEHDRFSAPQQESIEKQLATVKTDADARLAELAGNCERLNQELRAREAQISQLQMELSERIKEREQLRRQIDSIHASVCWRLTGPLRWLHKQACRARNALLTEHLL